MLAVTGMTCVVFSAEWVEGTWSACSKTCGGGQQISTYICSSGIDSDCNADEKPDFQIRDCETEECGNYQTNLIKFWFQI